MWTKLLIVVVTAVLAAADDAKTFEGTWVMVSAEEDGMKRDQEYVKTSRLVVQGDRHTVTLGGKPSPARHKLDSLTTPKTLDITWDDGTQFHAIYELSATEFKICLAPAGKPRPKEFAAPKGSGQLLHVWKREAK
jgi:uncharacterized protein (TIGR03067 family)